MAQSGPVDARAARLANALVGNDAARAAARADGARPVADRAAARAHRDRGAGRACPGSAASRPRRYTTLELAAGDRLSLPHTGQGARSYLAIAGGIESERFMEQREHRRARPRRAPAGRRRRARHRARGRLGDAHERARRLAGRRRDRAHPARPAGLARARSSGSTAPSCAPRRAIARACGSRGVEIPGGESVSEPPPLGAVQITPNGEPVRPARRPLPHGRLCEAGGRAPRRPADHRAAAARACACTSSSSSPALRWDLE